MGLKKITFYNKFDNSLKMSQIWQHAGSSSGAPFTWIKGVWKTKKWVFECIIIPHLYMEDLENLEINHKNKLYGWANKNGKTLNLKPWMNVLKAVAAFFTIGAVVDGELLAQGKAYNKRRQPDSRCHCHWQTGIE